MAYRISAQPPVTEATFVFFGIAIIWTYLLALFSIKRLAQALGPWRWRILRTVGLEYIALAFLSDFIRNPFHGGIKILLGYLPFLILAVTGPVLRLVAWASRAAHAPRGAPTTLGTSAPVSH
ncbi:MAG: hypothetical protein M3Y41_07110 [Pseudomonadota bacterium]|nr:hypothetical protein [Pseudomonadota bacterium]